MCHGPDRKLGDLDLSGLTLGADDPKAFERWVRVRERVELGEMPPPGAPRPKAAAAREFVARLDAALVDVALVRRDVSGRDGARRLTPVEYEDSVQELLAIDLPLAGLLPSEVLGDGFDRVPAAQRMSPFLLEKYLHAADAALDDAFAKALERSRPVRRDLKPQDLIRPTARGGIRESEDGMAMSWSSSFPFTGSLPGTVAPIPSWYRVRVTASAVNPPEGGRLWALLRGGRVSQREQRMEVFGALELTEAPREFQFDGWLWRGHFLQLRPWDSSATQAAGKSIAEYEPGEAEAAGLAGVKLHGVVMERFDLRGSPQQTRQALFGEAGPEPEDPEAVLETQLLALAERAYRRPVRVEEIAGFVELARDELADGYPAALRAGLRALLCSPRFLYLVEKRGPLDGHAVAARLSYMLWSSPPDAALMEAAESGALGTPSGRRAQLGRLLADSRSDRFVENFLDQWLKLNEIDFTQPDPLLYPDFDEVLKVSMLAETRRFFRFLLDEDLSVANLLDSDFVVINSRLARHYGLPQPSAMGFQQVKLPPGSLRGGLITHASVLKVTADGTTTSPVLRGAFFVDRILGRPAPPPPPDIPAVEPDIRGVTTIREQLAAHRDTPACSGCHQRIDPPGFALESFDAIGGYRERYRVLPTTKGRIRQSVPGPEVDAGYALANGTRFRDLGEFRALLGDQRPQLARNLAERLVAYGAGIRVDYADRPEVDKIVAKAAERDYGLRSLLEAVIESRLFRER